MTNLLNTYICEWLNNIKKWCSWERRFVSYRLRHERKVEVYWLYISVLLKTTTLGIIILIGNNITNEKLKSFSDLFVQNIDKEIKNIRETQMSNNGEISELDDKIRALEKEQIVLTKELKENKQSIAFAKESINKVNENFELCTRDRQEHEIHQKDTNVNLNVNEYKCVMCELKFHTWSHLKSHMNITLKKVNFQML